MKRIVSVAAVVAFALALTAFPSAAGGKDYTGPACNNFTGSDGVYTTFGGNEAFLSWSAMTEAPTCAKTTYTLNVLSSRGGTLLAAQPISGGAMMTCPDNAPASTSCISWTIDMGTAGTGGTAPSSICIYGTSSSSNNVSDRGPETPGSCIDLVLQSGASNGGGGFN
jgi:hypothetical protein